MGYNLEPIGEQDLDLESRFHGSSEAPSLRPQEDVSVPSQQEQVVSVERSVAESDRVYQNTLARVNDDSSNDYHQGHVAQDASDIHQETERANQVQKLVNLALEKSVEHAVGVAEHMEDYYVLDQLHDTLLSEDFHSALQERDMLSQK